MKRFITVLFLVVLFCVACSSSNNQTKQTPAPKQEISIEQREKIRHDLRVLRECLKGYQALADNIENKELNETIALFESISLCSEYRQIGETAAPPEIKFAKKQVIDIDSKLTKVKNEAAAYRAAINNQRTPSEEEWKVTVNTFFEALKACREADNFCAKYAVIAKVD